MKHLAFSVRHYFLAVFLFTAMAGIFISFSNTSSLDYPGIEDSSGNFVIPYSDDPVSLDGRCGTGEYAQATNQPLLYPSGFQGLVRIQHDEDNLYVCVSGDTGSLPERFFRVYLDSDNGKEPLAEQDDYAFQVDVVTSATSSYIGTGVADGYTPAPFVGWDGATLGFDQAEFKIPLEFVATQCRERFGIAVYHHWLTAVGDDHGWPSNMYFDQPQTWMEAELGGPDCPSATPTRTPMPTWTPRATHVPPPGPTATPFPLLYAVAYQPVLELVAPPIVVNPPDLSIHGIELTQGIQCFDTSNGLASCGDNSLPVLTKKSSTARIYLKYSGIFSSMNNVPVRLYIRANGIWYTANVSGKAIPTLNQATNDSANVYFTANFSNDVVVDFYAIIDPNNVVNESNESNNRFPAAGYITRTFQRGQDLDIVGQRLRYHPSGYSGDQYAGGWAVNGGAADWFEQMLPIRTNGIDYSIKSGYLNWTTSLGSGDGQHDLIQNLNMKWILENAFAWFFGSGAFTGAEHVYGFAPNDGYSGGHADMPVYPHAGGLGVVGIGTDRPGTSTDNPGGGALIFGHELVHDYDLKHTDTGADDCGSNDSSSPFPYSNSGIQEFGFNTITGKIYNPASTHDLMSYCPAGGSKEGWISPFTWNAMFGDLTLLAARQANPEETAVKTWRTTQSLESLVINATVYNPDAPDYDPNVPGELGELYRIKGGLAYTLPDGDYSIELRDSGNTTLAQQSFTISFESEYDPGLSSHPGPFPHPEGGEPPFPTEESAQADVSFVMPWADGTTQVVLLHNSTVLDTQAVTSNSPTVNITSPATAVAWPVGSEQTLTWAANDLDGDSLTYSVLYSYDGGVEWTLLAAELTDTSFTLEVDSLAGSSDGRFRVVATDGVNIGFDETDEAIVIPNKAPTPYIMEPTAHKIFLPGALVILQGGATDLEDGSLTDSALTWSSDQDGQLGSGTSLPINTLTPGPHVITLTARDSYGVESSINVNIFIGTGVYLPTVVNNP